MKAISLWQPWATLVVINAKQFETRHWQTARRGRILIHAAKIKDESEYFHDPAFRGALNSAGYYSFYDLPFGAIIGAVDIVEMVRTEDALNRGLISVREEQYGNYGPNRWAWQLANPVELKPAVPCRGLQNIFTVPAEVETVIRRQVCA